jgi:hypothetical protein
VRATSPNPSQRVRANANYPGVGYRVETMYRLIALEAQGEMIAPSGGLVSSLQQLFCSFDGTAILIRPVRSPMQVSY